MRAIRPDNRRPSMWRALLLTLAAIVVGGVGSVLALGLTNVIDLKGLAFWIPKKNPIPADYIAVPMSSQVIPAYTKITRDYLRMPRTGEWVVTWQAPQAIPKSVITERLNILDRVTAHEIAAGYAFKDSDFLPEGSSPGVAGGTPAGKQAITLDVSKLRGSLHDLKAGDHVNVMATIPVDMPGSGHSSGGRLGSVVAAPDASLLAKRSIVRPVVQDGVVVSPVRVRNEPIGASSLLTQGGGLRTKPVQEIVIAVDPDEVAPLAEAIDEKYEIFCVVHSGRPAEAKAAAPQPSGESAPAGPEEPKLAAAEVRTGRGGLPDRDSVKAKPSDTTPGYDPMSEVRFMEVMVGSQRNFVVFAGRGGSPVVQAQDPRQGTGAREAPPAGAAGERNTP